MTRAVAAAWRAEGHRITSDDWPGCVLPWKDFRVIISRNACAYRFQQWDAQHMRWGPTYGPSSPAGWASYFSASSPDLSRLLLSLPSDARDSAARLASEQGIAVPSGYRTRYWAAPDYGGVLQTDMNLRSVVDRTGRIYAIQFHSPSIHPSDVSRWITQTKGPSWFELVEHMARKTFNSDGPYGPDEKDAIYLRLSDLFVGLPDLARDGPWPVLKSLPPSAPSGRG
jgi:hypothetical protein